MDTTNQTQSELQFTVNGVSFKMIKVEGGTFTMGAHANQEDEADFDEKPAHSVTLSSYYIAETEVTQALWQAVMGNNPSSFQDNINNPVECVSYDRCQKFISKINALTNKQFRLPTEAEWEFAARGGNKSKDYIYAGSNNLDDVAWYADNSDGHTHPVKTKAPNELGLYDMTGNVLEWCNDCYGAFYPSTAQTNPQGPTSESGRVRRGGSWDDRASNCRSSDRFYSLFCRGNYLGFRLALDESKPQKEPQKEPQKDTATPTASELQFTVNGVSFKMIKVEGGTFTMGAHANQETKADSNEKPAHSVTLSSYYIAETVVTQALWLAVMGNNPSHFQFQDNHLNNPVECVSYNGCKKFISKLKAITGKQFRLPTEAEWEFAARGGNKSKDYIYAGSNNLDDVAWYCSNSGNHTHPVKTKAPNELGLYDMSGNVWEWCNDYLDNYPSTAQTNPQGPISGSYRVNRGCSWSLAAEYCRSSYRSGAAPFGHCYFFGFRLALDE
jgi:formylglycine-generating enzyme required for sulfatase activity